MGHRHNVTKLLYGTVTESSPNELKNGLEKVVSLKPLKVYRVNLKLTLTQTQVWFRTREMCEKVFSACGWVKCLWLCFLIKLQYSKRDSIIIVD